MEIEADAIISEESCDKYGVDDRRRVSAERVEDFVNRGLMTKAHVLDRLTDALIHTLVVGRPTGETELSNIKASFQTLRDPQTGHINQSLLTTSLLTTRSHSGSPTPHRFPFLPSASTALFSILAWNAAFPFPLPTAQHPPTIDQTGFIRAVCLLTTPPTARLNNSAYGVSSGTWGPHSAWLVQTRGTGARDLRRRLFRSLAVPRPRRLPAEEGGSGEGEGETVRIPVVRFLMYQARNRAASTRSLAVPGADDGDAHTDTDADADADTDPENNPDQQILVVAQEMERGVDVQDVLAATAPERGDRSTLDPLRESYGGLVGGGLLLPLPEHELGDLRVQRGVVRGLMMGLLGRDGGNGEDGGGVGGDDDEGFLSWEEFDGLVEKDQVLIFQALSDLFSVFKAGGGKE